jgi:hypothetical protein
MIGETHPAGSKDAGFEDRIFVEFFRKIQSDKTIPSALLTKLQDLRESDQLTKDRIREAIMEATADATQDKEDKN